MKFRLVLTFAEIYLTSQKYYERHSMAEGALNKTRENQLRTTKLKTIRAKKVNTQNSNSRYKKFWADFAFIGGSLFLFFLTIKEYPQKDSLSTLNNIFLALPTWISSHILCMT